MDGWRALSIFLVLGGHSAATQGFPIHLDPLFKWIFDSELGVRFFFVISGFLITWLLVNERNKYGYIDLKLFYVRRALRIWPVYYTFLLTLFILQVCTPYHQTFKMWAGNLLFFTNFIAILWPHGHLWSLAIEEQFYFLWPLILSKIKIESKKQILSVLAVPIMTAPVFRVMTHLKMAPAQWHFLVAYRSFFNYWDSLAVGCLCAFFLMGVHETDYGKLKSRSLYGLSFLLIFVPYILRHLLLLNALTVPLGPTCEAAGLGILMIQSVLFPEKQFFKLLNSRLFVLIGRLSYSLYIWQQIFSASPVTFGVNESWCFSFKYWLLPVFVCAFASYYFLETPFLKLRQKMRRI